MGLYERPRKRELDQVARQLVDRYPDSLLDAMDGVVIDSGHSSLTSQLVAHVENIWWPLSIVFRRKWVDTVASEEQQLKV